ncbi:hypothetical protein ACHAXA_001908 [Cyclostephanos tholiformis]|uniref:Mitochondrial carrier protein n=1 Tax=Cyclostephanos tholiformis TaxID=382380 RepID=A0ABD3RWB4_9STRA
MDNGYYFPPIGVFVAFEAIIMSITHRDSASILILSPDDTQPRTLIYCQSSSTSTTPAPAINGGRNASATSQPSSTTRTEPAPVLEGDGAGTISSTPSAILEAADGRELPPAIHAVGGSVGSALAILLFYPLERVRVELGTTARAGHVECRPERTDDNASNVMRSSFRTTVTESGLLDIRVTDVVTDTTQAHSRVEVIPYETNHATPDSSTGSFELVPSVKSSDAASLGTLSYDGVGCDNEEIPSGNSRGHAQLFDSSNFNSLSNVVCTGATSHDSDTEPLRSAEEPDFIPVQPRETIAQCLLRLHAEKSLYRGASHTVTTMMISNAVYFYSLQVIRRRLSSLRQNHGNQRLNFRGPISYFLHRISNTSSMVNSLIASTLSGCINVVLTNPLWVASLRAMEVDETQRQENLWKVMYKIAKNEGVSQLWNGTRTSLLLVSNPIVQHFAYEQLRVRLLKRCENRYFSGRYGSSTESRYGGGGNSVSLKAASLTPLEAFVCGALAKTLATVLTYPLQLAQTLLRLQTRAVEASSSPVATKADYHEGTYDCLCKQFSSGGIRALFHGMNAKMLQTVLTAAFTFMTYEQTLIIVSRIYDALVVGEARHSN